MYISYHHISTISAILSITLCAALLLFPDLIYWVFGIDGDDTSDFISRRAAMLFSALAIIAFFSRAEAHSKMRQIVCASFCVFLAALSVLGAFEFIRGFAGPGIWLAIIVELALALGYFRIWKSNR